MGKIRENVLNSINSEKNKSPSQSNNETEGVKFKVDM